ncbi:DUF1345 domain-containing protein [Agreia sp. Leaf283]|uniref:DUF1345 domain-containing protein n=1 Tax=Agreia sp. Leaf283 TaxID=1736321 RepID=UPI0009EA491E|nr:DUF1345 domain-containing protein [Agreia sp. Leaf283]
MATESKPRPPRFTSDVTRGYLAVFVAFVPMLAVPFALVFIGFTDATLLLVCGLFAAWVTVALLLAFLPALIFAKASGHQLSEWLAETTPPPGKRLMWSINGGGGVSWAFTGSAIAVAAVVGVSRDAGLRSEPIVVVLAILVVVGSLLVTMSAFAVRYARENALAGGAEFPGTEHPRFVDYVYLAIQVGTTFSTSDVTITTSRMRNIVSANSLIAFAFNTVVIALLVSVLLTSAT